MVLTLVAALTFTIVGLLTTGPANAGGNGQRVEVKVPPALGVIAFHVPSEIKVYARGTNHRDTFACTELEKIADSDNGATYGKPAESPWWWKGRIEFLIAGRVKDNLNSDYYQVAYFATPTKGIDEKRSDDVVKFEKVTTPWNSGAVDPELKFTAVPWEQYKNFCD